MVSCLSKPVLYFGATTGMYVCYTLRERIQKGMLCCISGERHIHKILKGKIVSIVIATNTVTALDRIGKKEWHYNINAQKCL